MYELDFIKIKNCSLKDVVKIMNTQTTDWDKMFANHISVKGLIPGMHKELSKLNN